MEVFICDLNKVSGNQGLIEKYTQLLPKHELDYYHSTILPKRKIQFLLGRSIIRTKLSEILKIPTQDIVITKTPNGKLELADKSLYFNISHSEDMVAVAIHDEPVGIDMEFIRMRDFDNVADKYFSREEASLIRSIKNDQAKKEQFYICWTRLEAFIKCSGKKISTISKQQEFASGYGFKSFYEGNYIISVAYEGGGSLNEVLIYSTIPLEMNDKFSMRSVDSILE